MTEMVVEVTAAHIAAAEMGHYENPVALALNGALEPAGLAPPGTAMIAVAKGYSLITSILDERADAKSFEANSSYHALLFGTAVRLPRTAQMVLSVFPYGPSAGLFAIRDKEGRMLSLRPYRQIVQPFTFSLAFLAPAPATIREAINDSIDTDFADANFADEEIYA